MKQIVLLCLFIPMLGEAQLTPEQKAQMERMDAIDRYIYSAPVFLDDSSEGKLREIAPVLEENCAEVPNPHADGILMYCTVEFQGGLSIDYRVFGQPQQLNIISIYMTSPQWVLKHELHVGQSFQEVVNTLGEPTDKTESTLIYTGLTEQARFEAKKGLVAGIRLNYYAD